jgi:hypothetical protein
VNLDSNGFRAFRIILDLLIAIALLGVVWVGGTVIDLDKRIVAIEANRFTQEDAADLQKQIAGLPSQAPPSWFLDRVEKLEDRIEAIDAKLSKLLESR